MKTQTSEMVPLGELVAHLGGSTEALDLWLKKFKVRPTSDWAGRPQVPADAAEKILKAYQENAAEQGPTV